MTIGERLKMIRADKSQEDFALEVGAKQATYARYERNVTKPDSQFLETLCIKYNINPTWLILGRGPMYMNGKVETGKETLEPKSKISYIDEATSIVDEAITETGVEVTPRQKEALVEVMREEFRQKMRKVLTALKGGPTKHVRSEGDA